MKTLHLTLKKKWFDLIASGVKTEEYREFNMFWGKRFANIIKTPHGGKWTPINAIMLEEGDSAWKNFTGGASMYKEFTHVLFANGGHFGDVPKMTFEFKGIEVRTGNPEWGASPGVKYFVIKLGERI